MDWPAIHAYAEEAELWTTLAINVWLMTAGVIFVVGRVRHDADSIEAQVVNSLVAGLAGGIAVAILCAVAALLGLPTAMSRAEQVITLITGALLFALAVWVCWNIQSRKTKW